MIVFNSDWGYTKNVNENQILSNQYTIVMEVDTCILRNVLVRKN